MKTDELRPKQAAEVVGKTVWWLWWARKNRPDFPKPVQDGPRKVIYFLSELEEWKRNRPRMVA